MIGAEIARHSEAMRARQTALLEELIGERLAASGSGTPAGFSVVLAGIGRALVMEDEMGIRSGHADARALARTHRAPRATRRCTAAGPGRRTGIRPAWNP